MVERFAVAPDPLYVQPTAGAPRVIVQWRGAEMDEFWSCVGKRANRHGRWIAMEVTTHQVMALHVEDRSQDSAEQLGANLPAGYREQAMVDTDQYAVYKSVIPLAHPRAISKLARQTNHGERFNCTLRQGVSRLVRATLAFSKNLANHIGALKYSICDYNLIRCAALPGSHHPRAGLQAVTKAAAAVRVVLIGCLAACCEVFAMVRAF